MNDPVSDTTPLPPSAAPEILYEDHHYIAVHKPGGLLTQAPEGIPSMETQVREYIRTSRGKPAGVYLGIPHRLDRPVSGVLLFACNTKAASKLSVQFQAHTVAKVYLAIVEGIVEGEEGEWEDFVHKIADEARSEIVTADHPNGKAARTAWKMIERRENTTLLRLSPHTGRTHQLRLQAAARGYPILGDALYGAKRTWGPESELPRDRLIALHAFRLTFEHPFRKVAMTIEAGNEDFAQQNLAPEAIASTIAWE